MHAGNQSTTRPAARTSTTRWRTSVRTSVLPRSSCWSSGRCFGMKSNTLRSRKCGSFFTRALLLCATRHPWGHFGKALPFSLTHGIDIAGYCTRWTWCEPIMPSHSPASTGCLLSADARVQADTLGIYHAQRRVPLSAARQVDGRIHHNPAPCHTAEPV